MIAPLVNAAALRGQHDADCLTERVEAVAESITVSSYRFGAALVNGSLAPAA